jgi:ubiquinone/menaquinone biosynthesis C-methylase UbiE
MNASGYRGPQRRDYALYRCPVTGSPLEERNEELVAVEGGRRYRLHDGVPDFASATVADNVKHDIQAFWDNAPCGITHPDFASLESGSPTYYADTERKRWETHRDFEKPFLREVAAFDAIRGRRVLEIGCGIGVDAIQFARGGNDLYVIDLSPNSVGQTLGRLASERLSAQAAVADAENLPFGADSFDVVYSFGVIHHSPSTERSVDQIHRVLKTGGTAIVMLYSRYSAMALLQTFLHYGIRKGQYFRLRSFQRVIDAWTELGSRTESSVNPLTRVFSVRECKAMFGKFAEVRTEKHFLRPSHFAEFGRFLAFVPQGMRARLPGLLGWNILIKVRK